MDYVIQAEDVAAIEAAALVSAPATEKSAKQLELEACFYGTLVDRDPESGVRRQGRAADGWRHGVSRPFEFEGRTFDVQPDLIDQVDGKVLRSGSDRTKGLFELLCRLIAEKEAAS